MKILESVFLMKVVFPEVSLPGLPWPLNDYITSTMNYGIFFFLFLRLIYLLNIYLTFIYNI